MNTKNISIALKCKNILGESCFWDFRNNSLFWSDIEGKKIWKLDNKNQSFNFNLSDRAGFILPRKNVIVRFVKFS